MTEVKSPKHSVLFVCLGNICRSTMAEIIMRALCVDELDNWLIDSCGTSAYHIGDTPDDRTVSTCRDLLESTISKKSSDHFKSIKLHKARQIHQDDFKNFKYIFVMDDSNLSNVQNFVNKRPELNNHTAIVTKLVVHHSTVKTNVVADPYYGGMNGFVEIYYQILDCCRNFKKSVEQQN
ncbi:acid phosphatase 1 [Tieghemostelium lacteum]|uniref:Acid phosphatase 1 n=1 Tax=Tieghemostelium lacteum TaxID=361077 RepID=A0A152A9H5_TIELA|nr:acid phosphatase 1 [Tieghemostelium lacteum]|eukprot:KYR02781.1 acid phosphatase 1 [Tieghemostelium lacteum]